MKKELKIEGMSCMHCAKAATDALKSVQGVADAEVFLAEKRALVECSADVTNEALTSAIEDAGFEVAGIS